MPTTVKKKTDRKTLPREGAPKLRKLRAERYGYTPAGKLRHLYLPDLAVACRPTSHVDKAAKSPLLDGRHDLTCQRCAGIVTRVHELREIPDAELDQLPAHLRRGTAWELA